MLDRFREDLPDLKADLYLVDGKPTESPTPIVIEDANDRQRYRLLSVSTFLAIDVEDVMEKGANWGILRRSHGLSKGLETTTPKCARFSRTSKSRKRRKILKEEGTTEPG